MTPDLEDKLDQDYRVTVIVAVAMIVSVFLYAGVVELLNRLTPSAGPTADPGTVEVWRKVLRGLALVHFLALAWLGRRTRRPEGEPSARLARLKTLTIVRLALAESIALYGLVNYFLSRDSIDFYYLLLVSLLSFTVVFPRYDRWRETLTRISAG